MKFNKDNCKVLHLSHGNPYYQYKLGDEKIEHSTAEKYLMVLVDGKLDISQLCAQKVNSTLASTKTRGEPQKGYKGWNTRLQGQAQRTRVVQSGEKKAPGRSDSSLSVSKGYYKKEGDRPFSRVCGDRTRRNSFKLEGEK